MPSALEARVAEREGRPPMDEPAFVAFYGRSADRVKGYLRRLTNDPALAEDLLQESFIRFLASGRVPADDDHRRNYLFRIATNLVRDHFRGQRTRIAGLAQLTSPPARSWELRTHEVPAADVWALLATLTPRDRELLVLAYVEGLTHAEIAQVTGLMRASLKPLLFRARRRFAAALRAAGLAPGAAGLS